MSILHTYRNFIVYIDISSYKGGKRVRIVELQKINGRPGYRLIKPIGTVRDDYELAILKKIAHADQMMLSDPNQLYLDLGENSLVVHKAVRPIHELHN